jgi:hypothetical protein
MSELKIIKIVHEIYLQMEQHTHPDNYATRFQCFMARNVFHMEQRK